MKKLIIWDFDGVISDTEHLWIKNWMVMLDKYFGMKLSEKDAYDLLGGMSIKTKIEVLINRGIEIGKNFLDDLAKLDWEVGQKEMKIIDGVENIFLLTQFKQCIATGGLLEKTKWKMDVLDLNKYFPADHIFTAQQVEHGKPAPDLFLFALEKMGAKAQEAVVIEDSIAGLTASIKAGIEPIAFVGSSFFDKDRHIKEIENLGVKNIFHNMKDLKSFFIE